MLLQAPRHDDTVVPQVKAPRDSMRRVRDERHVHFASAGALENMGYGGRFGKIMYVIDNMIRFKVVYSPPACLARRGRASLGPAWSKE